MDWQTETTKLPSAGKFYDVPGVSGEGTVTVGPMTSNEEKLLAGIKNQSDIHTKIDLIIQRCTKNAVPIEQMLITDRLFLLLKIRSLSYGSSYTFKLRCPNCGQQYDREIDLNELEVRYADADEGTPNGAIVEPFEVKLPISNKTVLLRFLRVADERDIIKYVQMRKRKTVEQGDPGYSYRTAKHIVSVDGEELDMGKMIVFVEGLHARDSLAIRNALDAHDFGINVEIEEECRFCDNLYTFYMPFDAEFFRPRSTAH